MQKQKVISTKVRVAAKQEMSYFSIRVPENAQKIIGIECGVRLLGNIPISLPPPPVTLFDSFGVKPNAATGHLRLHHPGCNGIFYAVTVATPDVMMGQADFTSTGVFPPQVWTHGFKKLEDVISIPKLAKIISAIYQNTSLTEHDLLVHVWYSIREGGQQ